MDLRVVYHSINKTFDTNTNEIIDPNHNRQ